MTEDEHAKVMSLKLTCKSLREKDPSNPELILEADDLDPQKFPRLTKPDKESDEFD